MTQSAPLTLRELQLVELELLDLFHRLCRDNALRYRLCGGTLLGAVRHQGFIPWDDDVDVLMPRPDFQRLRELDLSGLPEWCSFSPGGDGCAYPFAKLQDRRYTINTRYADATADRFVWIDIFPVDGLPESREEIARIYRQAAFWRRLQGLCHARLGQGSSGGKAAAKYLLKPLAKLYGSDRCGRRLERLATRYPFDGAGLVGDIVGGIYGPGEVMEREAFLAVQTVCFEGRQLPAMACWDSYLTGCHGDYMTLPPEEQRKTHIATVRRAGEDRT